MPKPGFMTPPQKNRQTGRVDTIPDSAVNAAVVGSPTEVDLAQTPLDCSPFPIDLSTTGLPAPITTHLDSIYAIGWSNGIYEPNLGFLHIPFPRLYFPILTGNIGIPSEYRM